MGILPEKLFFPSFRQPDAMDCGPTCLRIILKYYGKNFSLPKLRELSFTTREGSSLSHLANAAEALGFRTLGLKLSLEQLINEAPLPAIVHWEQQHYIVVYKATDTKVYVSDPAIGLITYTHNQFLEGWIGGKSKKEDKEGIALLFEATPHFYESENDDMEHKKTTFSFLLPYIRPYRSYLVQIFIGLLSGSLLSLIFPFLTQSVVDIGINNRDINFVYLILIAQLFLFFGQTAINLIQSWIVLHMNSRINISLVANFFVKLMKLPISFFDVKMTGDIMQRIQDHHQVEKLLTSSSIRVLFSMINVIVFGGILIFYDIKIFLVFLAGSLLFVGWITIFLKRRALINYEYFKLESKNQQKILELIQGMQEIKLGNAERQKRWEWEYIQARLFRTDVKGLNLDQVQSIGANVINEIKNIMVTFLTASLVIDGEITLGMMLAVSYIIGQLNGPIAELVAFLHDFQDAKLSLERLSEIHDREDEETNIEEQIKDIPSDADIHINKLSFQYGGPNSSWVLKNLNLDIPANKITAIVGGSGSGKTTLLKLLLKFYAPSRGEVLLNTFSLNNISQFSWRELTGVVMQEGFIFSDSIAKNIALGDEEIDKRKLVEACEIANIREFIEELPLAYNTKIGAEGIGLSGGQKQRLLIARAVYKNPKYLFFDEATSALDAKNERIIMENLNRWFKGKTVIIIAHRLSTVKNADQIVVIDQGRAIEIGTHSSLVKAEGVYYNLVKNQLELDKLDK
jgi:ATP-binding cassette subfamily B protein